MRNILLQLFSSLIFVLFVCLNVKAQTPPSNLNGEALKQWLKTNYYDGKHTELGYSLARLNMYQDIDNESNTLTCVYSGYQKSWSSSNTSTNPSPINCEHTVPQSFFGSAEPMKSDIHHLFPTYGDWNSERSSNPFSEIDDTQTTLWMYNSTSQSSKPTVNIDWYSESTGSRFEPREDHKGNVARAVFYFFTMYPTKVADISSVGNLATLYQWHLDDPVDSDEEARNNKIETYQGNRNPYIDMPELVQRAFINTNTGPDSPTASIEASTTNLVISWTNVANENGYKLYRSTDNTNFNQVTTLSTDELQYVDNVVSEGVNYYYYVIAFNSEGSSAQSNVVSAAVFSSGGGANDLFFSEYVEGSGYDKVVEVANFTGATIDLSAYSILKQSNGSGSWGSELSLSGSLASGDVFVVCHNDAGSAIKAVADLIEPTSSWTMSFNGNDPIGLFKNGSQIDAIGNFNSSSTFGEDVTLVRKASITGPSTNFSLSDWNSFAKGTLSYLGAHTMDSPTNIVNNDELENRLNIFPIPAKVSLNILLNDLENYKKYSLKMFDMTGKVVYFSLNNQISGNIHEIINVAHFSKGIYFLKLSLDDQVINKKVLIQ